MIRMKKPKDEDAAGAKQLRPTPFGLYRRPFQSLEGSLFVAFIAATSNAVTVRFPSTL
ncbi:MAG: hypothetical protein LBE49_02155 [Deltaproteobacteria bacterium]|nr:hypothetical protein [Deltaproteobacteria bacterium]